MKTISLILVLLSVAFAQQPFYFPQQQPGMFKAQPMYAQQAPMFPTPVPMPPSAPVPSAPMPTPTPIPTPTPAPATEQCKHGACCSSTKTFLPSGEPCRATTNPCEEIARCNGLSAECPENPKKNNGFACMVNGKCTDGFCTEYVCTGLCCVDGKTAPDGTACGSEDGKCVQGTCTVYRKADPHVKVLTDEEKEVIEKAQKQVKGEIEAVLRSHARYLKKKIQFEEAAQKNALEKLDHAMGTNVTGVVTNLASSAATSSNWGMYTIIAGLALIALAVVIIFVIQPKESAPAKKPKAPKKKTKADEDMTSADYDPPAF